MFTFDNLGDISSSLRRERRYSRKHLYGRRKMIFTKLGFKWIFYPYVHAQTEDKRVPKVFDFCFGIPQRKKEKKIPKEFQITFLTKILSSYVYPPWEPNIRRSK